MAWCAQTRFLIILYIFQVLISCGPMDGCHGGDAGVANKVRIVVIHWFSNLVYFPSLSGWQRMTSRTRLAPSTRPGGTTTGHRARRCLGQAWIQINSEVRHFLAENGWTFSDNFWQIFGFDCKILSCGAGARPAGRRLGATVLRHSTPTGWRSTGTWRATTRQYKIKNKN